MRGARWQNTLAEFRCLHTPPHPLHVIIIRCSELATLVGFFERDMEGFPAADRLRAHAGVDGHDCRPLKPAGTGRAVFCGRRSLFAFQPPPRPADLQSNEPILCKFISQRLRSLRDRGAAHEAARKASALMGPNGQVTRLLSEA
jgi:hypothetical protein